MPEQRLLFKKVGVFVDWENVRKNIFETAKHKQVRDINYNEVSNVFSFIKAFMDDTCEEIYRIFFYTALPFSGEIKGIDYSKTRVYSSAMNFIEQLSKREYIAVRKGIMKLKGFNMKQQPIFIQKQVDILLGLDIAHVSYHKLVDRVLILSGDTDLIPAMKVARTNGIQVILGYCPDVQKVSKKLLVHTDIIRDIQFRNINF